MLILFLFGFLGICFLFIAPTSVGAQCPVCIVTVGGGMLIAKKLGVDDLLAGIWISALDTAISFWLATGMKQKALWPKFLHNPWLFSLIMYGLVLFYFQFTGQIGHPANRLLGIDKIIFGQTIGLLAMFIGNFIYDYTKDKNGHKTLFPYAKIVFPVGLVLLTTILFKLVFHL